MYEPPSHPPLRSSSPSATYSRQPGATLTSFICHTHVSILSVAQAQQKSDYSEFYTFSEQECTFLKMIQEGTCFTCLTEPWQTPDSRRMGGSETCCFQLLVLSFSQKCPHRGNLIFSESELFICLLLLHPFHLYSLLYLILEV